ncbi:MAG TPA: tetratricopeptide repeat protein [Terriglobales bacterium]|nr:tetratricopeptide repeat protein [Terriglobales bacterium]
MRVRQGRGVAVVAWLLVASLLAGCAALGFETADSVMKEGQQLYADKKYDEAITKFERVLELDSNRWLAYVYIARCYIAKGGWKLAISNARLAYQAAPSGENVLATLADALLGGATASLRSGQFTEAITDFVEYIKLRPTDARGYLGAGQAYIGAGSYAEALNAFVRGFANDSNGALRQDLLKGLLDGGLQALRQGQAKNAVPLLQEYVQQDPGNAAGFMTLGKALIEAGYRSDALGALGRALQLNPNQPEATDLLRGLR